jgi:hypothetical protein
VIWHLSAPVYRVWGSEDVVLASEPPAPSRYRASGCVTDYTGIVTSLVLLALWW